VDRESGKVNFTGQKISFEPYKETIDKFKNNFIYNEIIECQNAVEVFSCYLEGVETHHLNFAYINTMGKIPEIYKDLANEGIYDKSRGKPPQKRWSGNCAPRRWKKSKENN